MRMAQQQVCASTEATEEIVRLHARLGNFILRHTGGEECAPELRPVGATIPRDPDDVSLGTVGGVLFMIDRQTDFGLGFPDFYLDVVPGRGRRRGGGAGVQPQLVSRTEHRD